MTNQKSYPVFYCREEGGFPNGEKVWVFDCPACGKKHTHGPVEGHRGAHCDNFPNGYEIKLGAKVKSSG